MRVNDIRSFDFGLGETADMLRDSVRGFAADKIAPRADEIDRSNTLHGPRRAHDADKPNHPAAEVRAPPKQTRRAPFETRRVVVATNERSRRDAGPAAVAVKLSQARARRHQARGSS